MAFYPIDRLRKGNIDFLIDFPTRDKDSLIVGIRNHPDRVNIINGFIDKLKDIDPYFCYRIIYDINEFNTLSYQLLIKYYKIKNLSLDMFQDILRNSSYRDYLIRNNLDEILELEDEKILSLSSYVIKNKDNLKDILFTISRSKNMHIRYLFMKELISKYEYLLNDIYDDICKYFIDYTYEENEQLSILPNFMDIKEICEIAILFLRNNNTEMYNKIKEYILSNYKNNYLGFMLDKRDIKVINGKIETRDDIEDFNLLKKKELKKDLDRLFQTSINYKIHLYQDYHKKLSQEIREDFERRTKYFRSDIALSSSNISSDERVKRLLRNSMGFGINVCNVYNHGLGDVLESYVDKYLALSERCDYEFVGQGSTCATYRIGDYAFKLIQAKWSYEDEICPNLFLIIKNLEEIYLRDERNIVFSGIEVQKYLSRSSREIDPKYFELFNDELSRLGYFVTDQLVKGVCGDNTALLDSYLDADTKNPSELPDWFKECPLVLIDRDRVYRKDAKRIRQLISGGGY